MDREPNCGGGETNSPRSGFIVVASFQFHLTVSPFRKRFPPMVSRRCMPKWKVYKQFNRRLDDSNKSDWLFSPFFSFGNWKIIKKVGLIDFVFIRSFCDVCRAMCGEGGRERRLAGLLSGYKRLPPEFIGKRTLRPSAAERSTFRHCWYYAVGVCSLLHSLLSHIHATGKYSARQYSAP